MQNYKSRISFALCLNILAWLFSLSLDENLKDSNEIWLLREERWDDFSQLHHIVQGWFVTVVSEAGKKVFARSKWRRFSNSKISMAWIDWAHCTVVEVLTLNSAIASEYTLYFCHDFDISYHGFDAAHNWTCRFGVSKTCTVQVSPTVEENSDNWLILTQYGHINKWPW